VGERLGHSVDIGLSQINSQNLSWVGLSVTQAFEPCSNLRAGAAILSTDYASASRRFGSGQYALRRALGAYNSGSLFAGNAYVDRILVAAGLPPEFAAAAPAAGVEKPRATQPKRPKPQPEQAFYRTEQSPGSPVLVIIGTP
jgi:type IV secretion system protein VirB1